ncbi:MAG: glycosyltransferase family 4 protein [Pseudomonadales bacterium]|nr:glycosyltransferase family 4 protein [Pseudomonadales bacterium]
MKILQVLPTLNSGGVEKGTLEIAQAIVAAGHDSWVVSAGGRLVDTLEREGSHHHCWDLGRKSLTSLLQIPKLRRWLIQEQFDVIHVRSRMPAWLVWLAWRKIPKTQRPRLVSTVHGLHSVNRYSQIMTCGERVIAVSKTGLAYIRENYPSTDPDKIRLIYRGIDPKQYPFNYAPGEEWRSAWFAAYPLLANRFVVTLPGRLTRLKGHLGFLQIIQALKAAGITVTGLIVGGEDPKRKGYAEEIRAQTAALGLEDDIIFTGHRADIMNIYKVSNAVVSLSSKPESFGRTVLETLSINVPVIGYAHGGVAEILTALYPHGAVTPGDTSAVTDRLTAIYQGDAPAILENKQFLLANMQQQTLDLYNELAGE